jgi:hypothetical protein
MVIYPPTKQNIDGPVIFLAGPIQGAADWQKEAAAIIQKLNPDVAIANPRREYLDGEFVYEQQVDWETAFLNHAAKNGAILFWLAKEQTQLPGRAYAQTSRFEIAEWKARYEQKPFNLIIGIEDGFTGARYIRHRLGQDCPDIKILTTLQEVCGAAVHGL